MTDTMNNRTQRFFFLTQPLVDEVEVIKQSHTHRKPMSELGPELNLKR